MHIIKNTLFVFQLTYYVTFHEKNYFCCVGCYALTSGRDHCFMTDLCT